MDKLNQREVSILTKITGSSGKSVGKKGYFYSEHSASLKKK
ncbi:hypothetical protein [Desulfogranum japonicum]|nr:hypothetical protein [Desulfogranum japonicum]